MIRKLTHLAAAFAVSLSCCAAVVNARPIENMMNFQARLTNDQGAALSGNHTLDFFIYGQDIGGVAVGSIPNVPVTIAANANGVVSLPIGPVQETWFNDAPRFLGIKIDGGTELSPRIRLTAVPFAMRAFNLPTTASIVVQAATISGPLQVGGSVGIGTRNPQYSLHVNGTDPVIGLTDASSSPKGTIRGNNGAYLFGYGGQPGFEEIAIGGHSGAPDSRFITLSAGGQTRMRIRADGAVGIGTDNPQMRLHVMGGVAIENSLDPQNGHWQLIPSAWGNDKFGITRSTTGLPYLVIEPNGNVGLGTTNPQARLTVDGTTRTTVLTITGGSDLAEPFAVSKVSGLHEQAKPGMVMVIDPQNPGQLKVATEAYDKKVAGVISGANGLNPGMVMKAEGQPHADGEHNVALTGRVWCWCDASFGAIEPGDRLTTSSTAGHAMKVMDSDRADGAVIGKAMTPLKSERGLVLVLVQPQ